MSKNNIPDFLIEEYENRRKYLKEISAYSLPNNPSSSGYSASDIKRKIYEPILQLYDWYYETKGEVETINKNLIQIFKFDFSAYLIASPNVNEFKVVGTASSELIENLKKCVSFEGFKDNIVTFNENYKIVHSTITLSEDKKNIIIDGLGIEVDRKIVCLFNIEVNLETSEISGYLRSSLDIEYLNERFNSIKEEILKICNERYVPKEDMVNIESYVDETGKQRNPLTKNGFIEIKTYN